MARDFSSPDMGLSVENPDDRSWKKSLKITYIIIVIYVYSEIPSSNALPLNLSEFPQENQELV